MKMGGDERENNDTHTLDLFCFIQCVCVCVCVIMALRRTLHGRNHHQLPGNKEKTLPDRNTAQTRLHYYCHRCVFVCVSVCVCVYVYNDTTALDKVLIAT